MDHPDGDDLRPAGEPRLRPADDPVQLNYDPKQDLESKISFHRRWNSITCFGYYITAGLGISFAAAASVVAGIGYAAAASIVAAIATVMAGLEKMLRFRERWDVHQAVQAEFEKVKREAATRGYTASTLSDRISEVSAWYIARRPKASRGGE